MADYPDTRDALFGLLDGATFAGRQVAAFYRLPADYVTRAKGGVSPVLIFPVGGTEGAIDRVDRLGVDVYAPGTASKDVAEAIHDLLIPRPYTSNTHDTSSGYLDDVQAETLPVDMPFADEVITQTQTVYRVTVRPA